MKLHEKAKYDNNGSNFKIGKTHCKKSNEVETKTSNPPPTQEEAKEYFEEQPQRSNENEKKKLNENQQPTTLTNRDSGKRPLSDSSDSPTMKHRNKRKNIKGERDDSPSSRRDPEINSGTSDDHQVSEFELFADPCCHELIQKCTGRHFACACQKQFYTCKCGWKLLKLDKGVYKCDSCDAIVANCVDLTVFR